MSDEIPNITSLGDACCGCGACSATCPRASIVMLGDAWGFVYPKVDVDRCVGCGLCDVACPVQGEQLVADAARVVWARSVDDGVLARTSSGGIFYELASDVIERGGAVCGASWDDGCMSLRHTVVREERGLENLLRSKYVQSELPRDTYEEVRSLLLAGIDVLFCGTACQVAGMRSYLGELANTRRFIGVDVICHGVPSPALWRKWLDHVCKSEKVQAKEVNFRSKVRGWRQFSVDYSVEGEGGDDDVFRSVAHNEDWYMRAFLANASLRPSCFSCCAKRACGSDITLGDFWGIEKEHPEVGADNRGVSAVLVNTNKGEELLTAVLDSCKWGVSSFEKVASHNSALTVSGEPFEDYENFMTAVADGTEIGSLMRRWSFKATLSQRIRAKLGRMGKLVLLRGR